MGNYEEDYDEATIVHLADGVRVIGATDFDTAFGQYSNAKGKRQARQAARQQKRTAKKAAKQQKKMTRIDNRVQKKTARKVGRQTVKANKAVAKQAKKAVKQQAKQVRKTNKVALKQGRKAVKQDARIARKDNRVNSRVARQAVKQGPEELPYEDELLDQPLAESGSEEMETGFEPDAESQDYAQNESVGDEGYEEAPEGEEEYADEESYPEEEEGYVEEGDEAVDEEEWTPDDYEDDADIDETEYGFNGDMDAASNFDASVRQPSPEVLDKVKRIERNKFKIFCLEKKLNAQGGDQLGMQAEINQRSQRIAELKEQLYSNFSNAKGKRAEKKAAKQEAKAVKQEAKAAKKAVKAEVKAAKKEAKREIKAQAQVQRAAAPKRGPIAKAKAKVAARKPAPPPPPPAPIPVDEELGAEYSENEIDIPAEDSAEYEEFTGNKAEGIIARDDRNDYDAPKARVFELHSNASGSGVSGGKVVTFIALSALGVYLAKKYL